MQGCEAGTADVHLCQYILGHRDGIPQIKESEMEKALTRLAGESDKISGDNPGRQLIL